MEFKKGEMVEFDLWAEFGMTRPCQVEILSQADKDGMHMVRMPGGGRMSCHSDFLTRIAC